MKINHLKNKLESGKSVIGTFSVIPSTIVTDIIASSGLDFIVIDGEHGPINFETAQNMIIACESRYISPAVRVSGVNENEILKALDIGAHCVHIPNVTSKKELLSAVKFAKYPPVGKRGFSPFTRAGGYSGKSAKSHTHTANTNTLLAIHIEGTEAIENIDVLLKFKELDIVFVGLFDLSKSLGKPGQVNDPKVLNLLRKVVDKTLRAGKTPGTIATSFQQLELLLSCGIKYITYSVECDIIIDSFCKINQHFRSIIK